MQANDEFWSAVNSEKFQNSSKSTAVLGEFRTIDIMESLHTLIAGASRDINDILIRNIIVSLSLKNSNEDAEIILLDPNYDGLKIYEDFPLVEKPMYYRHDDIRAILEELKREENRRIYPSCFMRRSIK